MITVQIADFDVGLEYQQLCSSHQVGAVVTFVGRVRDFAEHETLWLEHYPGMTEKVLGELCDQAKQRWPIQQLRLIHRVGTLAAGDQIVFVGISSQHRQAAFDACQWLMDMLKTQAPFWKKEGQKWVDAKPHDLLAASRWLTSSDPQP